MINNKILIHYGELALKGKNRAFFENKLISNLKVALEDFDFSLEKNYGNIILTFNGGVAPGFYTRCSDAIKNVFGISNFIFIKTIKSDLKIIEKSVLEMIKNKQFKTFRVTTNRLDKDFKLISQEIDAKIGESVLKADFTKSTPKKVQLKNPDLEIFIDLAKKETHIYTSDEKHQGAGGLPVGTSGKLVSLISSGIDSPVASYLMMKRGAKIIYAHFHSHPFTSKDSEENVKEIIKTLEKYNLSTKLYSIPIGELQKKISVEAPSNLRIILYRRIMIKISNLIAKKEKALGLVTGEALGQVASQTLENMLVTDDASDLPIYRPLISFDKEEVISLARQIETYEISIRPADDCCTYLAPPQVATKAKLDEILKIEEDLDIDKKLPEFIKIVEKE